MSSPPSNSSHIVPSTPAKGGWLTKFAKVKELPAVVHAAGISQNLDVEFGLGATNVAAIMGGSERRVIRDRRLIYDKLSDMAYNSIVSTGLNLMTTAALGGHETTGQLVFIETNPAIKGDKALEKISKEISRDLTGFFNKVASQLSYTACWAGDSYARIHTDSKRGVTGLFLDETFSPPLVQPWEQGGKTVGFSVYTGEKDYERLTTMQMARMKMPRKNFVPQFSIFEKSRRLNITEDDIDSAPLIPGLAGGSLLLACEDPYDNLCSTLSAMVASRINDSIDEEVIGINLNNMTVEQQTRLITSVTKMFKDTRERALKAIKSGRMVPERVRHVVPVNSDKQVMSLMRGNESRVNAPSIEDAMLHARLLAGAFGLDLSLLGFADQMSGGLGEGGFFRNSAQVGEAARVIRTALTEFFDSVIDVHTVLRYGVLFPEGSKPWQMNYYGSISALESERQSTRLNMVNSSLLMAQAMDALKSLGLSEDVMVTYMTKQMGLDEDEARTYAADIYAAAKKSEAAGGAGGFGG